ncbi:alginate lyase [Paenibacillus prosopidis]|uniref:Alginate lyase n=2 Tax=Paenibacillus prosopidis TaxID=630520 RepID=A0A368W1I3_9BACL|nr:alginate lyase [Paenibacillus prosopidis]
MKRTIRMLGIISLLITMVFTTFSMQNETVSASTATELSPIADSYVNSGAVSTNYGTATSMVTKESAANDRSAYLKFDLSGLTGSSVSSATLRLYVKSLTAAADRTAYSVSTDTWTESGLTYSNMPAFGNPAGSVRVTNTGWVEFDVTSYVMSEFAGDEIVSLYIKDPIADNDIGIDFYSKENGSTQPVLSVITEPARFHPAPTDSTPFVHPGALFKRSDLERMKYMVDAQKEPWLTSYNQLKADSKASYDYVVRGNSSWTVVARGGIHGPEFESDVTAAYFNSLMWAITGDSRHAAKAVEIFNSWSNLTEMTGGGTEALNAGLYAWKLVEAAEIIKSTYTGWSASDLQKFKDMLVYPGYSQTSVPASVTANNGTFYWRIYNGDSGRHGNQDIIPFRAMLSMGVFLDNRVMYDRALRYFKGLPHRSDDIPYASGPSNPGAQSATNDYFDTFVQSKQTTVADWGYNGVIRNYVWSNGQNQESSRDQQHAFLGLGMLECVSDVAWNQGDDLWNYLDNRLLKGFEFMGQYNTSFVQSYPDQTTPWEPTNFIKRFDRTGRWYSKQINQYFESNFTNVSRGDFAVNRPVYEQAVAHFQVRMGLSDDEAKWTKRSRDYAISASGYEKTGFSLDHPGWGALTFRRPSLAAGDPIKGFSGGAPQFGMHVLPGAVEAENYDYFPIDGEGRTYHDLTVSNSGGQYRDDGVDIKSVSTNNYALTDLDNGEWFTYTVHVPVTGNYKINVDYEASNGNGSIKFAFDGTDATSNVTLPSTGGASNWSTYTVASNAALTKGVQAMRVFVSGTSDAFHLNRILISNSGAAAVTTDVSAAADSYVNSGAVSTNYGADTYMVTKQSTSNDRSAYLKFDLSGITGTVISAKLKLNVKSKSANADRTVYDVADDSWTETGITYTNRPAIGGAIATKPVTSLGWIELDVTSAVAAQNAGDKIVSLYVKDPIATNNIGIDFFTKENGSNSPVLTVVTN